MRYVAYVVLGVVAILSFLFLVREHPMTPNRTPAAHTTPADSLSQELQTSRLKIETYCVHMVVTHLRSEVIAIKLHTDNDTTRLSEVKKILDETSRVISGSCMQYLKPLAEHDEKLKRSLERVMHYREHGEIVVPPRTRKSGASFLSL